MDRIQNIQACVRIPQVNREERIGMALNNIFSIIFQTEQTVAGKDEKVLWDFSDCRFLHPFYIGSLAVLKMVYGSRVECVNIHPALKGYLDIVFFHSPLTIEPDNAKEDAIWSRYKFKSYLPICRFQPKERSASKAQELVQATVVQQIHASPKFHEVLSLLLSELVDNITEHSGSDYGFMFCQTMQRSKMLYVFICDIGKSIYSSYALDERYADMLTNLESSALELALQGKSTKDRPEAENRGYGISKSRKVIVEGLKGEFLLLSGGAFFRHDANGETMVDLPGDIRWNGTMALLKIPTIEPAGFDIYNYIS